ncbi:unnamed protein product [Mytilus coruscus]|uniref:Uncharacterized protein n=1 Tax=Mytilus coruscus TaxID=42192 RepID=A0A6J8AR33_MYTCO|nr:unnamed protein product [Mytilus coruscus]
MTMYSLIGSVIVLLILCHSLVGITFVKSDDCNNISGNLTLTENIHFLFIGESANMTCSIQKQSIQNFSADNFIVTVKRCGVTSPLPKILNETSDLMEMYVTDLIRDLHCGDQIMLEYKCIYDTKNGSSCPIGERDLIYFDFRPSPVKSFHCLVYNWFNMTCWFDLGVVYRGWKLPGYTMVDVKVKYGILGIAEELDQQYIERDGTCLKISIPQKIFMGLMYTEIDINITNEARKVSNISIFKFNPRTFVKPASIENLKYERNATAIKLTWTHNNTQMSKKFRIQYSSEYDPKGSWMQKEYVQIFPRSKMRELKVEVPMVSLRKC